MFPKPKNNKTVFSWIFFLEYLESQWSFLRLRVPLPFELWDYQEDQAITHFEHRWAYTPLLYPDICFLVCIVNQRWRSAWFANCNDILAFFRVMTTVDYIWMVCAPCCLEWYTSGQTENPREIMVLFHLSSNKQPHTLQLSNFNINIKFHQSL